MYLAEEGVPSPRKDEKAMKAMLKKAVRWNHKTEVEKLENLGSKGARSSRSL
jgi:hypothetical protein